MAILGAFDDHHGRLSLSDVARRADLPLTTVHRLVAELLRHGALARAGDDYVIGRRVWEIGLLAPVESPLRETITQPGRLNEQLAQIRRTGYATTMEEMSLGACSVAVPIHRQEQVVAAIGIVVRTLRRDRGRLIAALQVAAQGISRQLGAVPAVVKPGRTAPGA